MCGTPTPRAPRLRRSRGPGWLVAALVVLGLGAGALAWAIAADDDDAATTSAVTTVTDQPTDTVAGTVDTSPVGTLPSDTTGSVSVPTDATESVDTGFVTVTSGTDTLPTDTGGLPTDTTGIPTGTTDTGTDEFPTDTFPTETTADVTSEWPVGTSAWTAIISSVGDPAEASATRDQAVADGVGAKILLSDDHSGLTPGLYVVYVGVFQDRAAAVSQASRLQDRYPGAYARYITA